MSSVRRVCRLLLRAFMLVSAFVIITKSFVYVARSCRFTRGQQRLQHVHDCVRVGMTEADVLGVVGKPDMIVTGSESHVMFMYLCGVSPHRRTRTWVGGYSVDFGDGVVTVVEPSVVKRYP